MLNSILNLIHDTQDKEIKVLYGNYDQRNFQFEFVLEDSYMPETDSKLYYRLKEDRDRFTDTYLDQPFVYQMKIIDVNASNLLYH